MRMLWFGGARNRDHNGNQMPIFLAIIPLILAPIAATMLKAAVSRKRESLADATAVSFTRNPAGLRAALEVLARDNTVVEARSSAVAHLYIESPLDASAASKPICRRRSKSPKLKRARLEPLVGLPQLQFHQMY